MMAKIGLTEGFTLIPEGTHVFRIVEVNYKEDFGKMEIIMQTASGQKHTERFSLLDKHGNPNQGALNAFSYFAKQALNDFSLTEIDHDDLVGHYLRCVVEHEEVPSNKNPDKILKFVRLVEKESCDGFEEVPAPKEKPEPEEAPKQEKASKVTPQPLDLDKLLNS